MKLKCDQNINRLILCPRQMHLLRLRTEPIRFHLLVKPRIEIQVYVQFDIEPLNFEVNMGHYLPSTN